MAEKIYIGNDQEHAKKATWLGEAGDVVQKLFSEHNHGFILIPCVNVDDITPEEIEAGEIYVGTCLTDIQDPVSFAVGVAGAISSFGMTSKDKGKGEAAVKLAETILDMVKEVRKVKKNDKKER